MSSNLRVLMRNYGAEDAKIWIFQVDVSAEQLFSPFPPLKSAETSFRCKLCRKTDTGGKVEKHSRLQQEVPPHLSL